MFVHPPPPKKNLTITFALLESHACQSKYNEDELIEAIKGIHIIGVRSKTKLTARVLEAANKLTAVGCFCIGTDQTNLKVAASKGIPVFNAPYANTRSVSELVIANIIHLARQTGDRNKEMHAGEWNKRSKGCVHPSPSACIYQQSRHATLGHHSLASLHFTPLLCSPHSTVIPLVQVL